MSQKDDSENDIWDYKPLEKKKKRQKSPSAVAAITKRRCASRKTSTRDTAFSVKAPEKVKTAESGHFSTVVNVDGRRSVETNTLPSKLSPTHETVQTDNAAQGPSSGDFCPMCQMPFSILVVQTQRWHVAECLDSPRDKCRGTDIHFSSYILLNGTTTSETSHKNCLYLLTYIH